MSCFEENNFILEEKMAEPIPKLELPIPFLRGKAGLKIVLLKFAIKRSISDENETKRSISDENETEEVSRDEKENQI